VGYTTSLWKARVSQNTQKGKRIQKQVLNQLQEKATNPKLEKRETECKGNGVQQWRGKKPDKKGKKRGKSKTRTTGQACDRCFTKKMSKK